MDLNRVSSTLVCTFPPLLRTPLMFWISVRMWNMTGWTSIHSSVGTNGKEKERVLEILRDMSRSLIYYNIIQSSRSISSILEIENSFVAQFK